MKVLVDFDKCEKCPFFLAYPTEPNIEPDKPPRRSWGFRCGATDNSKMCWERLADVPEIPPVGCPAKSGCYGIAWRGRVKNIVEGKTDESK